MRVNRSWANTLSLLDRGPTMQESRKNSQELERYMVERIMVNSMAKMSRARWEECEWG